MCQNYNKKEHTHTHCNDQVVSSLSTIVLVDVVFFVNGLLHCIQLIDVLR